jgi:hypothetical protein
VGHCGKFVGLLFVGLCDAPHLPALDGFLMALPVGMLGLGTLFVVDAGLFTLWRERARTLVGV